MPRIKSTARKNSQPPTPPTFETDEAVDKFYASVSQKPICAEKGFAFTKSEDLGYPAFITSVITQHNWKKLCTHQMYACAPIVREFYSNMKQGEQQLVYMRGIHVRLDAQTINRWYELPEDIDEHGAFAESVSNEEFHNIVNELCITGTQCSRSSQGALTFLRNRLKPEAKVWYHFLRLSLMPTGHLKTVTKERALLLHSIIHGRKINVGKIIMAEIQEQGNKPRGRLYFPCFITRLCEWAEVPIGEDDERILNSGAITTIAISRISHEGATPEEAPTEAGPSEVHEAATPSHFNQRLESIEATQQTMLAEIRQIRRNQRQMQNDQRTYWSYIQRWDKAVQQNMRANARQFYNFPQFPTDILIAPSSSDEE